MKELCEKLAEQYAEDKSKAYYIDQHGDQKWYITERGRYSKDDFLAGYKAAKDQLADADKVMCSTTMEEIKAVDTGELMPITNLPTSAK